MRRFDGCGRWQALERQEILHTARARAGISYREAVSTVAGAVA